MNYFFHDENVISEFTNFKKGSQITHFFSKNCNIIENDNRLILHYDNPIRYEDENIWQLVRNN